jgi:hypothetical protein
MFFFFTGSRDCQAKDWTAHKKVCKGKGAAATAAAAGSRSGGAGADGSNAHLATAHVPASSYVAPDGLAQRPQAGEHVQGAPAQGAGDPQKKLI